MKIKASPRGRKVVVELDPQESALPAIALPELALKRILVPVDFSRESRKALHYAISFAKQFGSEILLVHVVEIIPAVDPVEGGAFNVQLRQTAIANLEQWRKEVAAEVTVKTELADGAPFHQIVRAADENNADLIVLGTHGLTGLARFFIGSTAERVVRHAPCPVLVVREREHDFLAQERIPSAKRKSRK